MITIYALVDPRDHRCRYVGKTKHTPEQRLKGHLADARRRGGCIARFRWINQVLAAGNTPRAITLAVVHPEDWQAAEQMWVSEMKARFPDLLNATAGGDGIHEHRHTPETRERQATAARQRYRDPAERTRSGAAVRKAYENPETRARLGVAVKAALSTPEVKARLSAAQLKSCARPEVKEKRSKALKGRVFSPEHRQRISDSRRGKPLSETVIARIAAGHVGLKHSEETKAKMRAAWVLRKAREAAR